MEAKNKLVNENEIKSAAEKCAKVLEQLNIIMIGRPELHKMVLIGILSQGHILLEGLPGVGKTALIKALGELMQLDFNRVQFTPDLMPGDILGAHILQLKEDNSREMQFQPGPVFTNILLADEINRASPKTQSALLEAMQERSVTLLGTTRDLPRPFFVLASQNPIELEGTYPLPEAQLDRFLFKLEVKNADVHTLKEIIFTRRHGEPPKPEFHITQEELNQIFSVLNRIYLPGPVAEYIARLVNSTDPFSNKSNDLVKQFVQYGASPRAAIAVAEAARAVALLDGRPTVGFEDVKEVLIPALNHRLLLNYKAKFEGVTTKDILNNLIESVGETELDFANDIEIEKRSNREK